MRHVKRHDCVQNPTGTGPAGHRQSPQGTDDAVSLVAPPCRSGRARAGGGMTEPRHRCRYCRTTLKAPEDNDRQAFCTRGCHSSHYRKRCVVCEAKFERKNEGQKVCGRRLCRNALKSRPELYSYARARIDAAKDQGVRTEVARAGILVRPNFVSSPKYRGCVSGTNRPPRWPIGRC